MRDIWKVICIGSRINGINKYSMMDECYVIMKPILLNFKCNRTYSVYLFILIRRIGRSPIVNKNCLL